MSFIVDKPFRKLVALNCDFEAGTPYAGFYAGQKWGKNTDLDTGSVPETVWAVGGDWVPDDTASNPVVSSDDTSDTDGGTGARTIRIVGLDSDWNVQTTDVTMNGTTDVTAGDSYLRIFRVYVLTVGSSLTNEGVITITNNAGTKTLAQIDDGLGQTQIVAFSVPAGHTMLIDRLDGALRRNSNSGANADLSLYIRRGANNSDAPWRVASNATIHIESPRTIEWNGGIIVPEKSDVKLQVTSISDSNTGVNGKFDWLMKVDD